MTAKMRPRLPAKGTGLTAEQILQVAEQHGIPIQIPLADEIPYKLYVAVAEVIALRTSQTAKHPTAIIHEH